MYCNPYLSTGAEGGFYFNSPCHSLFDQESGCFCSPCPAALDSAPLGVAPFRAPKTGLEASLRPYVACTPPAGAKPKVPALCDIGVLTLQREGEDSAWEPPTAAAESKRKKFVMSNAAEETYNLQR